MTLVSVVIPCYNSQNFIERAINSVLAQTHQSFELILVNNNSTDDTLNILNRFKQQYPEKIIVLQEQRAGAPFARNLGLAHSGGEWVQFLDADDIIYADKLETDLSSAQQSLADVIINDYNKTGLDGAVRTVTAQDDIWRGLIISKLGITSSCLWRKKSLEAAQGWAETLTSSQEYDLLFRLIVAGCKIELSHRVSAQTFLQSESVSQTVDQRKLKKVILNRISLRYSIQQYLKQKGLLSQYVTKDITAYVIRQILLLKTDLAFMQEQFSVLLKKLPLAARFPVMYQYLAFYLETSYPRRSPRQRQLMMPWILITHASMLF
jgi:hypothetical protein